MAVLHIVDASGREWQYTLVPSTICSIGRAPDNCIVLNDPRVSRHHAHIRWDDGVFTIVDGVIVDGQLRPSANHVFVNGAQQKNHPLSDGDRITIGLRRCGARPTSSPCFTR